MTQQLTPHETPERKDQDAPSRIPSKWIWWIQLPSFRRKATLVVLSALLIAAIACASQPEPSGALSPQELDFGAQVTGFLLGMFHGFLMVFNIIASLFFDVRIYQFPNTGRLYDLGFVFGAAAFLSGSRGALRNEDAVRSVEQQPSARNGFPQTATEIETMISSMEDEERAALKTFVEGALACLPRYRRISI